MNDIVFCTDAEVAFILPFDASTGDLKVTSGYGSDDTLTESQRACGGTDPDWCGNDKVNASFVAEPPDDPPLTCLAPNCPSPPPSLVGGLPSVPQYVDGTWDMNNGSGELMLSLTQGQQDASGDWPITGAVENSPCSGQLADVTGVLDQYGDMALYFPCGNSCVEWLVLGSGDVTSQGFGGSGGGCAVQPVQNFLQTLMDESEGPYYYLAQPPLFKSATDQPSGETPTFDSWGLGPSWDASVNPTFGEWSRQFPEVLSGGNLLVEFAGRFVYEQNGAGASDSCYTEGAPSAPSWIRPVTGLSGGGWFVTSAGVWEYDDIGESSQWVDWYQSNVALPCDWTVSQEMYIDGRTTTYKYTLNQLTYEIDSNEIYSEVQPQGGSVVKGCEYYSGSKVGKKPCKP